MEQYAVRYVELQQINIAAKLYEKKIEAWILQFSNVSVGVQDRYEVLLRDTEKHDMKELRRRVQSVSTV